MTDGRPPKKRRKEARPKEIIAAALANFQRKGFAATRIDDVAREAGVTKGTVYLYFPSKEALFMAAIRDTVSSSIDHIEEAARQCPDAEGRLRLSILMWCEAITRSPYNIFKLIIADAGNFPESARFFQEEIGDRIRSLLDGIVLAGIASNEFRPCDARTVTRALISPLLLHDIWRRTFPEQQDSLADIPAAVDSLLDVVLNGIASRK